MPRPRIEISLAKIRNFAANMHTLAGIAARLGVSHDTLQERLKEPEFRRAYEEGREMCCAEIRDLQMQAARAGNITMLIWLGKQMLGQTDTVQTQFGGPGGAPFQIEIVRVAVQRVQAQGELEPASEAPEIVRLNGKTE